MTTNPTRKPCPKIIHSKHIHEATITVKDETAKTVKSADSRQCVSRNVSNLFNEMDISNNLVIGHRISDLSTAIDTHAAPINIAVLASNLSVK
jgi:hypothetical protein